MASFFDTTPEVVPLITCENGKYIVCEETLKWIESIGNFAIVVAAGKYRTGKSFLLNRLAQAESNMGFGVGDSVQACTKGLWMYKKVFKSHGKNILFIDTEGIDALDANDTHDVRIFTLALLLSSTFIYNSVGPIDETALQTLSLMTRVTENVKVNADDEINNIAPHMPTFYWILRDFSLKITDKDNIEISEDEYLENALASTSDPNKNSVREAIRASFDKRSLITLPRPSSTVDPAQIRMEDRLMSLSSSFTTSVDNLRSRLFEECSVMKADKTLISGNMYAVLCRHYASIVEGDSIPVIQDSWTLLASVHARDLKDMLIAECKEKISSMKPKPKEALHEDMQHLKKTFMEKFISKTMKPMDENVKKSMNDALDTMILEASKHLEINISEAVEKSLSKIEPWIEECPEDLAVIMNKEMLLFTEEHDNQLEFAKNWMVSASERALCRWIPRSLQTLSSERDAHHKKLKETEENHKKVLEMLETEKEEIICREKIKHSELEQLNVSNQEYMQMEKDDNMRLRSEIISISYEMRLIEESLNMKDKYDSGTIEISNQDNKDVLDIQDNLSEITLECAELRAKLATEKNNYDKYFRMYKDSNERLEKTMSMQAVLEESFKTNINKLRNEQKESFERQRQEFDTRVVIMENENTKLQNSNEQQSLQIKDMVAENTRLQNKIYQDSLLQETTIAGLRETANKYREQSDQAQNRVLEIHKSMLDDLRMRDERAREQQCKFIKETNDYQHKISETTRENESYKSECMHLKRKMSELEPIELEVKKMKTSEKEKEIRIAQLNAEVNETRSLNTEMLQEREKYRRENMEMERELTLLRAEKQMNEVRKSMSINTDS